MAENGLRVMGVVIFEFFNDQSKGRAI